MNTEDATHESHPLADDILSADAMAFLADLQRTFGHRREQLLEDRRARRQRVLDGERPSYPAETEYIRRQPWTVAAPPKDLEDRRVEITGSPGPEFMVEALGSGARVLMADFEDACSPTWSNVLVGHQAIRDFYRGALTVGDERSFGPDEDHATLIVGVRGLHQTEPRVRVDGGEMWASLFDFGLCAFLSARAALDDGSGPYFSIPKLESHLEARLWAEVIDHVERALALDRGAIRVTVLIETIFAAFEMDEILYELRDHACGLNAGRSDYLFSIAKTFGHSPDFILPDRCDIRIEVPFMRAFGELLVATCHRRGAHAIGGVTAAFPDDHDPEATRQALARVSADKRREAGDGFDGTLVAHVATTPFARREFDRVLGERPNQIEIQRDDVYITAGDLLSVRSTVGSTTETGIRANVSLGVRYLAAWLTGIGTVPIDHVMVDLSAAEFSRAQLWQWIHHQVELTNGRRLTRALARQIIDEECESIRAELGDEAWQSGRYDDARDVFERLALAEEFADHLTLTAAELIQPA